MNIESVSPTIKSKIILLPEFSLPLEYERELSQIAKSTGAVIITGLDFIVSALEEKKIVENKAFIIVPNSWPNSRRSTSTSKFYFGKHFFSNPEINLFGENFERKGNLSMYILDAGDYGNIGVAICADFFDIERFVIYKGRIHHMFVIAHNKDVNSFYFLAEAIARLVFCNVVICNTGYYGGSIVFSPFKDLYKRYIYKHEGGKLFTSQVLSLPVKDLDEFQKDPNLSLRNDKERKFKSLPPNYKQKKLTTRSE